MKDIASHAPTSLMAKVGVSKKEKSTSKKQKDSKPRPKIVNPSKINKFTVKKPKTKKNNVAKKKSEKKTVLSKKKKEKKEPKKKHFKELKTEKTLKNLPTDTGNKRKFARKNHVDKKNGDHTPQAKALSGLSDANKLINGNVSPGATPTTRNPWVLKLDISPQQAKPVTNGVPSNGTLALCNKSVIFIPKNNSVSGVILKRGPSLPFVNKKELISVEKSLQAAKQPVSKLSAISNKGLVKNGFDATTLSQGVGAKKKSEANKTSMKKESEVTFTKDQKSYLMNGQKPSSHSLQDSKSVDKDRKLVKTKNQMYPKDQKPASTNVKPITIKVESVKSLICKHQVCLNSKECAKCQKSANKETKPCVSRMKKSTVQDKKALCLREQPKVHPQRMASLDAMAKMHVICSTDRRMPLEPSKLVPVKSNEGPQIKSTSQKIHVGIKKEVHEIKERVIHSRINCLKFEESSVSESTENVRTFCSFSQEQEEQTVSKRPRGRPRLKPLADLTEEKPPKFSNRRTSSKLLLKEPKLKNFVKKASKGVKGQKASILEKTSKSSKVKEPEIKVKKSQKQNLSKKSKVKVKETIRLRKTCTFQSVTTVSSHKAVNSVVSSCSRLGVTTNFETKKTVVRDQACEKKSNFRLEELQGTFMPSLDSPCSVSHSSNCGHNLHSSPHPVIPLAHSQSCHRPQGTEKSNTSQPFLCDGSFPVHRCNHKEPVMCHHMSHDCGYNYNGKACYRGSGNGCCCSSSLSQSMHESCVLPKETNACAHSSYCHLNSIRYPSCSCCHSIPPAEHERHLPSTANFPNRWCSCHEPCHNSSAFHQKVGCSLCSRVAKPCTPLVPFDQIPLDLSLGAPNPQSVEKSNGQSRMPCQSHHYCQDHVPFQSSPHRCQFNHHCSYVPSACPSCWNRNSDFKEQEKSPPVQRTVIDGQCATTESMPILTSISSYSNDETTSANLICQEISAIHNYACNSAKQERNSSTRLSVPKKRKFAHGWSWEGEPAERMIALTNDSIPAPKRCYPALRHREGDIIKERDCVLLKSGPKDTDLPYVAKVAAFWENPDDGEMMMSLLWYYRPEHTEQGRRSGQMDDEVFASKHRDVNSVACIEDKCFVLTFNEYCRYRANLATVDVTSASQAALTVPEPVSGYPRQHRLPTDCVSPDMIFFCRHVYDFRQKRILKNPT